MAPSDGEAAKSPVALLIFKRPDVTARMFEAVRRARPPRLFVAADGPREGVEGEAAACAAARAVTEAVDWPCEVERDYAEVNLGCRDRITSGISWVFSRTEEAIFLEDDCVPGPDFFRFCDELLERHRDDERVMHVGGDNLRAGRHGNGSYYLSRYPHVWGWASWRRAWDSYDSNLTAWSDPDVRREVLARLPSDGERRFWTWIWDTTAAGGVDTWDYQWVFECVRRNGFSINPNVNLVTNIGFGEGSTHTGEDPHGFAGLPAEPIDFPLLDPEPFEIELEADALTAERIFSVPPGFEPPQAPDPAPAPAPSPGLRTAASRWLRRSR